MTQYAAGGSPGYNMKDTEGYQMGQHMVSLLKEAGHNSAHVIYNGTGYQGNYFCLVYQISGLEENRRDVLHLLSPLLQGGTIVDEPKGKAKAYIPRFRTTGSTATLASLVVLTFCVFLLLAFLYLLLHYFDPMVFYLPGWLDPF